MWGSNFSWVIASLPYLIKAGFGCGRSLLIQLFNFAICWLAEWKTPSHTSFWSLTHLPSTLKKESGIWRSGHRRMRNSKAILQGFNEECISFSWQGKAEGSCVPTESCCHHQWQLFTECLSCIWSPVRCLWQWLSTGVHFASFSFPENVWQCLEAFLNCHD